MEKLTYVAISGILAFCSWMLVAIVIRAFRNPLSSFPGPWMSKWADVVLKYQWLKGQRPEYVHRLHQIYGPVVRVSPGELDISDIGAAREIHRVGGPFMKSAWYQNLNFAGAYNVFNTIDPEYHSRHRRLLSSPLSDTSLKLFEPVITARVSLAIDKIGEEMKIRGAADIFKWWSFMSTDIIGELTFGDSFRMLDQGKKNQYMMDIEKVAFFGGIQTAFPMMIKFASIFPIPFFREVIDSGRRIMQYSNESIQRYRRHVITEPSNPKPTLFTKLFRAGEEGMSDDEIESEAQAFIIGGSDTISNTLTYLVWSVCRDVEIKQKLVADLAQLPNDFRDQDLRSLPYLNQVVAEALRLYAAAPSALPRSVPSGGATLAGYWIPGGVTVSTQAYSLHRDPAAFPQPDKFDPARWERPTKAMKEAYMPFGGGTRICIGIHLAYMELRGATARFFRAFPKAKPSALENMRDDDMEPEIYFLMTPKGHRCLIQAS